VVRVAELEEMYELEDSYWWFVGRRRMLRRLISIYAPTDRPLRILDAGCGTGGTMAALAALGETHGCDLSADALAMCRSRGDWELSCSTVEAMAYPDERFDVVVAPVACWWRRCPRTCGCGASMTRPWGIYAATAAGSSGSWWRARGCRRRN